MEGVSKVNTALAAGPTLTLILPADHEEVKDGGLLAEKRFDAGQVSIVVHSMLTHRYNGVVTVNGRVPELQVVVKSEPLPFLREPQAVEEFTKAFANALQQAQIHQMQVQKYVEDRIDELVRVWVGIP